MGRMANLDPFSKARLCREINEFREKNGTYPTLKDLSQVGFSKKEIQTAVAQKVIVQIYVNLTNGSTVKGFKVSI